MKKFFLTIAAVAMITACSKPVAEQVVLEEYGPYTIERIEDGIWHLRDCNSAFPPAESTDSLGQPRYNNCSDMYLLTGDSAALLVDLSNHITWSDTAAESLRHLVSKYSHGLPLTITFTHNHGDHIGMLPAYLTDSAVRFALPEHDFADRMELFRGTQFFFYQEGFSFHLGGLNVSTVEVPGHTPGSMVFSIKGRHILLTGDAVGSGHGVWIFDEEGFRLYKQGVPHLMDFVRNPANGIDTTLLRIYGGHYHQKEWLCDGAHFSTRKGDGHVVCPDSTALLNPGEELGMTYLQDMELALKEAVAGTARTEPFEMVWRDMDTYYIHGSASIVAPHAAVR